MIKRNKQPFKRWKLKCNLTNSTIPVFLFILMCFILADEILVLIKWNLWFTHCILFRLCPGEIVVMVVVPANASIVAWSGSDPCWVTIHPTGQSHLCKMMKLGAYTHTHTHRHITQTHHTRATVPDTQSPCSPFNVLWCNQSILRKHSVCLSAVLHSVY